MPETPSPWSEVRAQLDRMVRLLNCGIACHPGERALKYMFALEEVDAHRNDLKAAIAKVDTLERGHAAMRDALERIVNDGVRFDAKGTHSKCVVQVARAALKEPTA